MTATIQRQPRNGVDVPTLFATLDAVKGTPELAKFQFRARNEWVSGTHNRSTIQGFYGAGTEDTTRTQPFSYDADHPAVLVGTNQGPTPVEFLLHGRRRLGRGASTPCRRRAISHAVAGHSLAGGDRRSLGTPAPCGRRPRRRPS